MRSEVCARIRSERLRQGLTQEQLALTSGTPRNVLIDIEHGYRSSLYERIFDIAAALGVSVAALLTYRD
nr:helix-turn-helix transcriptional regulator [Mycobacteroides abscessus]